MDAEDLAKAALKAIDDWLDEEIVRCLVKIGYMYNSNFRYYGTTKKPIGSDGPFI